MSEGADPLIGQRFRGYRIERPIARGGMGAVYLARDEALLNVCKVIKVLLEERAADEAIRAFVLDRFEREALTVSVLQHDNIVGIHAVGTLDDGQPCMLMDYVDGQPLDEVIRSYKGRVPPYRVMHYMCHVARGLDFAHALGIVHRDLKPANIMVCPTDNDPHFCKLLDFGIAKLTRPIAAGQLVPTMGGQGLGTPSFMAVEQFRHADEATVVSDVYSLAIIIWFMVSGELPWGQHDTSNPVGLSVLYEMQRDKAPCPPPPRTLPPAWERTLRAAMSPDPDARPPSVRHFMVDLAIGLEPEGPHVKGGVEILRSIAPKFIAESGPDVETVRDTPHRTIVVAWPRAETPVRPATAGLLTRPAQPRQQPGQPTPIFRAGSGAELGAAQGAAAPASASTLGASNGVIRSDLRKSNGWKFALLAVVAACVTTVILFAVMSGGERPTAATAPPPPSITAPTIEITPPPSAAPLAPPPPAPGPAAPMTRIAVPVATTASPPPSKPSVSHTAGTMPTASTSPIARATTTPSAHTTPAATSPTVTAPAPPKTITTSRAATRPNSPPASTKKRSHEPHVPERKHDRNAPADEED